MTAAAPEHVNSLADPTSTALSRFSVHYLLSCSQGSSTHQSAYTGIIRTGATEELVVAQTSSAVLRPSDHVGPVRLNSLGVQCVANANRSRKTMPTEPRRRVLESCPAPDSPTSSAAISTDQVIQNAEKTAYRGSVENSIPANSQNTPPTRVCSAMATAL